MPAKSLTFLPFYFGQAKGIFYEEGIDPELIVMRPPIGIVALEAGDVAYSAAPGVGMRAAILTPPYTSMATLAGYVDLGDAFEIRDVQGGLELKSRRRK